MPLIFAALVLAAFFVWHRRSNELFYLSVRDGRVLVVRGRIPAGLLSDFKDVLGGVSLGRKITFSIDIQNINYKRIIGKLAEHE